MTELDQIIVNMAKQYGLEPTSALAVKTVEFSANHCFFDDESPSIKFEGHIFYKFYNKKHPKVNRTLFEKKHPDIYFPYPFSKYYKEGLKEYDRLYKACKLDKESALKSTLWGFAQIPGFEYSKCDCESVYELVEKVGISEESQVKLWMNYLKNSDLIEVINQHNWTDFVTKYNGDTQIVYYTRMLKVYYEKYSK